MLVFWLFCKVFRLRDGCGMIVRSPFSFKLVFWTVSWSKFMFWKVWAANVLFHIRAWDSTQQRRGPEWQPFWQVQWLALHRPRTPVKQSPTTQPQIDQFESWTATLFLDCNSFSQHNYLFVARCLDYRLIYGSVLRFRILLNGCFQKCKHTPLGLNKLACCYTPPPNQRINNKRGARAPRLFSQFRQSRLDERYFEITRFTSTTSVLLVIILSINFRPSRRYENVIVKTRLSPPWPISLFRIATQKAHILKSSVSPRGRICVTTLFGQLWNHTKHATTYCRFRPGETLMFNCSSDSPGRKRHFVLVWG